MLVFTIFNCTNVYMGIDGPDVISREAAVGKLNKAYLSKSAACGFSETNLIFLLNNYSISPRKVLDGKYYATSDIDSCVNKINLGSCDTYLVPCVISPKSFFDGGGLPPQGGF